MTTLPRPRSPRSHPRRTAGLLLLVIGVASGCRSRDVQKDLEIVDVHTGWFDMGTGTDGQTKLVPSISMKLKNVSQEPISGVQIDAVFRNVNEEQIIDEHFVPGVASNVQLGPGNSTPAIVLRSKWGFTGSETRSQMLQNSKFVDARVTILGRHGRNNWAPMKVVDIDRRLLAQ